MVKLLVPLFCASLNFCIITSSSFAQNNNILATSFMNAEIKAPNDVIQFDRSTYYKIANYYVTSKIIRSFDESFTDATDVIWYNERKSYLASFIKDGKTYRVLFSKNGGIDYKISFGSEKDLPADLRKLIKSEYVDYAIGRVTEVNVYNKKAWFANLEDAHNLIIVRIVDGAIDEFEHYQTQIVPKQKKCKIIIP
jgi:hypothetical protein